MRESRAERWLQAVFLTAPLVIMIGWMAIGAINRSQGPAATAALPSVPSPRDPLTASLKRMDLPSPDSDLPADRLEERVDGAADYLRGLGCRRLIAWKLASPAADLEMLVFDRNEGAVAALARDAGKQRDAGPGDEASVSDQAILFRRGAFYARLMADPDSPAGPGQLLSTASELDLALKAGAAAGGPAGQREGG